MNLNFPARLAARLAEMPRPKKADRTRELLKIAAARVLEKKGYIELRVIDITNEANMSEGIFYKYFKDKKDICYLVLSEFMHYIPMERYNFHLGTGSPFDAILRANITWFACARANSGLIRCVSQFEDSESDFAGSSQRVFRDWHDLTLRKIIEHYPEGAIAKDALEIVLYALTGMVDEITRLMWVNPNLDLRNLLERNGATENDLAEVLAIIWHRTVYPVVDVPPVNGSIAKALMALGKVD